MDIVDTHAHIYAPDEERYPPIEDPLRPPGGKGSLEDLRAEMESNGVRAACIIQTSSFYRFDNRYILDCSRSAPGWTAGVCTLDPENPKSPGDLVSYVRDYGIKGIRSNPASGGRLDHPGVRALWKAATDLGLVINVHIRHELAGQADKLLQDFSSASVILDHTLYPKVGPVMQEILSTVRRLSEHPNLHAKLSFVATGSRKGYPCEDMHSACLQVIHWFGPERCVWGSDFPCELWTPRVTYSEALKIFREVLPLSRAAREKILGETARRLWFNG